MKKKEIKEKLKSFGLKKASKFVCSCASECIRLKTTRTKEEEIMIGESKIGGHPDLPENVEWPNINGVLLSFLAQINLKDLNNFEKCKDLPESGWLYFFYEFDHEAYGYDPQDKNAWRVLYIDASAEKLSRRNHPEVTKQSSTIYSSCKINFYKALSVPGWESVQCTVRGEDEKGREKYEEFLDSISESDPCDKKHQLFGFPMEVQGDMRGECELYSRGLDYNKVQTLRKSEIKDIEKNALKWCLLFQFDSDENAEMMWMDAGRLYFWIKPEDLRNRNFNKIWMILQCY